MNASPERLDRFMARANAAYYADRDPFADFATAPEISQAFGEVLGLWAAITWDLLGRPAPVVFAEAGPGRGTLMSDALRAIGQAAPEFRSCLEVHLIETSPRLRALQGDRIQGATWHEGIGTLPDLPLILLANEFLDALPIRQFVYRSGAWMERWVEAGCFLERAPAEASLILEGIRGGKELPADGSIMEVRQAALAFVAALGARFVTRPGAALFLDYGPTDSTLGDSLQALRAGAPADPLSDPGRADLTAHVDFAALVAAAEASGARAQGPVPQGVFLTRLGLLQRTDRLARTQPPGKALALIQSARRLVEPDQMGRLFKAMAVACPSCPALPGFQA